MLPVDEQGGFSLGAFDVQVCLAYTTQTLCAEITTSRVEA